MLFCSALFIPLTSNTRILNPALKMSQIPHPAKPILDPLTPFYVTPD